MTEAVKTCTQCREAKALDCFKFTAPRLRPSGNMSAGSYGSECRSCLCQRARDYRRANPEVVRAADKRRYDNSGARGARSRRDGHYRRTFGITVDDYERMLAEQGGKCHLCHGRPVASKSRRSGNARLHVDHDHQTDKVRRLLCYRCNVGLGLFRDNVAVLSRAIAYIKEHRRG